MNLTKINLLGFKSFADKVEIDFTSGITCIVGPNGCGKSNVSDAIRWVLGEQSPKTLRAPEMTDVIFGGTINRKSLSYCEVSLTFDNTDRAYNVTADEVVVSRRLYRGKVATSEYLINGQQVRMRDIVELFRDTGIGKEGYSIIGQGKTDAILSQKPDERRKIFEEAAGVASYRNKKQEAERNLSRTKDNMVMILSVMDELEKTLRPLEKQSEDAKKVRALREELKVLEVNTYLYQSESSSGITSNLEKTIKRLTSEAEANRAAEKDAERAYNLAIVDFSNIDIYIEKMRNELSDLLVNQQRAAGENKLYSEQIARLREELLKIGNDNAANDALEQSKTAELASKEAERDLKNREYIDANFQFEKINQEYVLFVDSVSQREKEVERSRELIMSSADELSDAKSATVKLVATRDVILNNIGEDKDVLKEKRGKIVAAKNAVSKLDEEISMLCADKAEKESELELANSNLASCTQELDESQIRYRDVEKQRVETDSALRWMSDVKNRLDNYVDSVKALIIARDNDLEVNARVLGVIGEMITVPKDLQLAIEIALGGNMQNVVVNSPSDARFLIDYLNRARIGRATFLPVSAMRINELKDDRVLDEDGVIGVAADLIKYDRKIYPIISNLLGRTIVAEDKTVAERITAKYRNEFRVVTLDGAFYLQSGAITGGQAPAKETRILARESELEELKKRKANLDKALEAIKRDVNDKISEQRNLQSARNIIASQVDKLTSVISGVQAQRMVAMAELTTLETDEKAILSGNEDAYRRIKELDLLIEQSAVAEKSVVSKKTASTDVLSAMKAEVFELRQKRDKMAEEVGNLKLVITNLNNDLNTLDREITRLNTEIKNAQAIRIDLRARKATAEQQIVVAESKIDTTKFSQEDQARIDEIKGEVERCKDYKLKLTSEMQLLSDKRSELTKVFSELSNKIAAAQAKLERLKEDLLSMEAKIVEDYQLDRESAESFRRADFDAENSLQNISRIKRRIDSFGAINELAVEQFEEQSGRFGELKTQYDDLEKAKSDTEKVIADLTAEMEKVFNEAFTNINENFKTIFAELFEGGKAELRLNRDNGESVLDAPIDIYAQPKGKNLRSISLLSGGEKSFTAIAILFAIIQLKPMPFCVLDEIESALDDVNTGLFAEYVKKYAGRTQFIVITHKKPTMERADTLYGITMQEVGVSTVVSVKLSEAIKFAPKE